MNRFLLLTIILILTTSACAQDTAVKDVSLIEQKLLKMACEGVAENGKCRIPYPYSEEFWGVCCGGSCRARTTDCTKSGEAGTPLLEAMKATPCRNKATGAKCEFSDELIKRFGVYGVCCQNRCLYWESECVARQKDAEMASPVDAKAGFDANTPIIGSKAEKENIQVSGIGQWLLIAALVVVCLMAAVLVVYLATRKRGGPVFDEELQIQNLLKEKKTVEEMIELAKAKYHKRTLDEDSFKEIVTENQKKLIEIEARLSGLEARTKKLEEK